MVVAETRKSQKATILAAIAHVRHPFMVAVALATFRNQTFTGVTALASTASTDVAAMATS